LSSNNLLIPLRTDQESIALSELSYGGVSIFLESATYPQIPEIMNSEILDLRCPYRPLKG
jgi:hypothetical protein